MANLGTLAKRWIPVLVTIGALGFLFVKLDVTTALQQVRAGTVLAFLAALLTYIALALALEARSIHRLVTHASSAPGLWTCARMKAASYPLALVNIALGGAALSILLNRRAGMRLSDAAGVVGLILACDFGILMALTALGAAWLRADGPAVQAGAVSIAVVGMVVGIVLLRSDRSLGPIDRLRQLDLFRAARETPAGVLVELVCLRLLFVTGLIALVGATLLAFGVVVPLGNLVVSFAAVMLVSALPIAVAGLGTGQVAFVYFFGAWGAPETLLAASILLSTGLIVVRGTLGLVFAGEFTREVLNEAREAQA